MKSDADDDYILELEDEIQLLESREREYLLKHTSLSSIDEQVARSNQHIAHLNLQIAKSDQILSDLKGSILNSVRTIGDAIDNTVVSPQLENTLCTFKSHFLNYQSLLGNYQEMLAKLDVDHAQKKIALQTTLTQLYDTEKLLSSKYSEFGSIHETAQVAGPPAPITDGHQLDLPVISKGIKSLAKFARNHTRRRSKSFGENVLDASADSLKFQGDDKKSIIERPYHLFIPRYYRSPKRCDSCLESMWGKELRCEACNFHCHTKCSSGITGTCPPKIKNTSKPEVMDLIAYMKRDEGVPKFLKSCIEEIESHGMDLEGIYRKSGKQTQVNELMAACSQLDFPVIGGSVNPLEISAVTSALKQFIRQLPISLITPDVYESLLPLIGIVRSSRIRFRLRFSQHAQRFQIKIGRLAGRTLLLP